MNATISTFSNQLNLVVLSSSLLVAVACDDGGGAAADEGLSRGGAEARSGGGSNSVGGSFASGGDLGKGGVLGSGAAPGAGGESRSSGGEGSGALPSSAGGRSSAGGGFESGGTDSGGSSSGGAPDGGSGGSSSPVISDQEAASAIVTCIDSLPWGQDEFAKNQDEISAAIINTCAEFSPPGDQWQSYCQMFLAASINKESSYNAASVVEDAYGGASDPTVGLLQVRFSSTVKDYVEGGNLAAMDRIGCDLSGVDIAGDGAGHMDLMQNPTCNIALGAWYYFVYASGNGGTSVTYLYQYCAGEGSGADLKRGMLSHLMGPQGALDESADDGGYVDTITEWFDECMKVNGYALGSPHPFDLPLSPSPATYCSE